MVLSNSFLDDPEDTREAIMKATYEALCEHGYAGLTIARIADDFEKSKSLLYHHYDSKDELLLDFLSYMLEEFERTVPGTATKPADERLQTVFDHSLSSTPGDESLDFMRAMVELRAQAAHDDRFRDHFTDNDQVVHDKLVEILADGIEEGVFRDVDEDQVASFLLATLSGGMNQRVTSKIGQERRVMAELDRYVDAVLLTE
ncbi:TetR/AcrR family transcriptional regulator [Halodesulfurarchaeum sp.]|uniref:TetR/AcrR family transcriptional regulator n=1 Tax=Halodesulfurarchaeum sp. TaxID=1980530 RepID=UPI002FC3C725